MRPMKLNSKYIYLIVFSILFPIQYSDYGFEIFSFSGDAKIQSMGGAPHGESMSLSDLYSLNEFHDKGKISFSYAKHYSGMIDFFQSSYIA